MSEDAAPTSLSPSQVTELLALTRQADSVELKVTVPDEGVGYRSTAEALEIDVLDAQIRQVFFFDTPDLRLNAAGVVVRARRSQGAPDDSVVKLRPVDPRELPDHLRRVSGFGVEVDALPGGFVCSASLKAKLDGPHVREAALGRHPVRKLFSKPQRAFYGEHAPDGADLDSLSILGPMNVLKLKFNPPALGRRMVAEMWLYPDGSRILELSTKCPPDEAFRAAAEARSFLVERGVNVTGEQQTKTAAALAYFSQELGR